MRNLAIQEARPGIYWRLVPPVLLLSLEPLLIFKTIHRFSASYGSLRWIEVRMVELARNRQSDLRIVKLTPIALSFCASCKAEFTSTAPVEDDAEAEMKRAFDAHRCN